MKSIVAKLLAAAPCWLTVLAVAPALAQQYNSDSYLSKPHGMATVILTSGERNTMWMTTFSLFPNWEFTAAAYLYDIDDDRTTEDGYSTSYYAKYMFYENAAKTGGFAVKAGTGMDPGYISAYGLEDAFQTYWMNAPATVPFLDGHVSWDIMPGASVTRNYGVDESTAAAFTYSTRLAWYPFDMETSIVGEVFGSEGEVRTIPEYKVGLRWEPNQHVVLALTYGAEFDGPNGAGFEIGAMLFSPPFLKL
jgi:hypothetical protein